MTTMTYEYTSGAAFAYDSTKIGFADSTALLILGDAAGKTFVPTLSASTLPGSLTYSSGAIRQIDQRPANATYYASWANQLNANWSGPGNGSLTVNAFGGAAVASSKLNLTGGGSKYVTFAGTNNADSLQTGTIEFQITPNYSGSPSVDQFFLNLSQAQNSNINMIDIDHFTDGRIYVDLYDQTGGDFVLELSHPFNPTAGTTYNILLQFNATAGTATLSVDGTAVDTESTTPWVRSGAVAYGVIGNSYDGSGTGADFSIANFAYYSTVLTPSGAILNQTIYIAAAATLPLFTYSGLGTFQAYTSLAVTDDSVPVYTLNGLYWNGSAWVTSNNSAAQANTVAAINTNIATLPFSSTLQVKAVFPPGPVQGTLSSLTVTYTGQGYPTDAPAIGPLTPLTAVAVTEFTPMATTPDSTHVNYYFGLGGVNYYWNGSAWVVSDGSYMESNTASDITTNLATLPISGGAFVVPFALLYTPDGLSTPSITSLAVTYEYFAPAPPSPNVCTVYGYIVDESDAPVQGAIVTIRNPVTYINAGVIVAQGQFTATSDVDGYFSMQLIETASLSTIVAMSFIVTYPFIVSQNIGSPANTFSFGSAVIPNVPEANLATLTFM